MQVEELKAFGEDSNWSPGCTWVSLVYALSLFIFLIPSLTLLQGNTWDLTHQTQHIHCTIPSFNPTLRVPNMGSNRYCRCNRRSLIRSCICPCPDQRTSCKSFRWVRGWRLAWTVQVCYARPHKLPFAYLTRFITAQMLCGKMSFYFSQRLSLSYSSLLGRSEWRYLLGFSCLQLRWGHV